jgi:hypothetical protein
MAKTRRSNGLFGRLYSPIHHGLFAARNVVNAGLGAVGKIVNAGVEGVDKAGASVTGHANAAVHNVFRGLRGGVRRKTGKHHSRKHKRRTHKRKH